MPILARVDGRPLKFNGALISTAQSVGVPATAAAGAELPVDHIFQRVGTSKAVILAGTHTPPNASALEVRVETVGGAMVVDWSPATLSSGSFSVSVSVPQGLWYRWKVRDAGTHAVLFTSTRSFGVGVRIALIGQSNQAYGYTMGGPQATGYPLPSDNFRRYSGAGWGGLNVGDNGVPGPSGPHGDGPRLMSNALAAAMPGVPFGLFEYAVNGTSIAGWSPGGGNYATFTASISSMVAQDAGDFEMALWHQGESDSYGALGQTEYTNYLAALATLVNGYRTFTGRASSSLRFGITLLGPMVGYPDGAYTRRAMLAFIQANAGSGVFLGASAADADLTADAQGNGDGIQHINTKSQYRKYRRYAQSIARQLVPGSFAYGADGPAISGAVRNVAASTIQVSVVHSGGTALRDGAGGTTGASISGLRVFKNGSSTPETISATAFAAGGITLTLGTAFTSGDTLTLDHQATSAPYGASTADAAVVCDNAVLPSNPPVSTYYGGIGGAVDPVWTEARGLPLQPTVAAITVT